MPATLGAVPSSISMEAAMTRTYVFKQLRVALGVAVAATSFAVAAPTTAGATALLYPSAKAACDAQGATSYGEAPVADGIHTVIFCSGVAAGGLAEIGAVVNAARTGAQAGFTADTGFPSCGSSTNIDPNGPWSFTIRACGIAVQVSGSQTYGSVSPTFTQTNDAAQFAETLTGTLACTTANGGTPIDSTLGVAISPYTIDGSSCSGLTSGNDHLIELYSGVTGGFVVSPAAQSINFPLPADVAYGSQSTIVAASATSTLPVSFVSDTTGVCMAFGVTVIVVRSGSCTIRAQQAGDANWSAAADVAQSFPVGGFMGNGVIEAPEQCDDGNTFNGDGCSPTGEVQIQPSFVPGTRPPLTASVGQAYGYPFVATGLPAAITYALIGAPAWLSIDGNGVVGGTPPTGTTSFTYSVTATNSAGVATSGPYTVAVTAPPPASTKADVSTTLSCPASAKINVNASCTLTVRNAGPATAKNVWVALALPSSLTRVSNSTGGTWWRNVVTWKVASLNASATSTFTITFNARTTGKTLIGAATASTNPDPNWKNNITATTVTLTR